MNTENKNIPALRFPEFDSEWISQELNQFISERNEQPKENLPLYSLTIEEGIVPKSKRYERSFLVKSEEEAYKVMVKDDFAFNPMNLRFGALARHKGTEKVLVSKYYNIFFCKERANPSFVENYLTSYKMLQFYKKMATGSLEEKKRVHYLDFVNFNIPFPTLPEQQKIAAFLTAVDKRIQQLAKKKDLLGQYKKGVLQKIFNQEIRFKDPSGNDFADWEEKKFGEIFSFRTTNSYSRENLNYETGKVKNIHYGDIHTKFNSLFDITKEYVPFINEEVSLKKIAENNYCREGDLVIADASEDYADVGKCIEITNLNSEKVLAGLHTFLARPDFYKMPIGFSSYLMKSRKVRLQIMTIAQGTKVLSISTGRLSDVKLDIPSEPEQQKITSFLSAIDVKINLVNQQLEKTKQYKKSLLQKMFV